MRPRRHRAAELPDHLVAHRVRVGAEIPQDLGRDPLVLADEPEQQMLGADVVVPEREALAQRQLEHLLRARCERDLARRRLVALADDARDLCADLIERDVEFGEDPRGDALFLAEQAEQQVLGADVVVAQLARLVLREDDDLACSLCEALERKRELTPP